MKSSSEKKQVEGHNREELINALEREHKNQYSILSEKEKTIYSFPFKFAKKYFLEVEIEEKLVNEELEKKKKSLLESLTAEKGVSKREIVHENQEKVKAYLISQEIAPEIVEKWMNELKNGKRERLSEKELLDYLKEKIQKTLSFEERTKLNGVCLFFGVTGIGKTTTVVKIAKGLQKTNKVGIITTDNYKMGAYHQMEQYAKNLDITLVKSKVDELDFPINAMKYAEEKQVILIDTAGRSPKHPEMKAEIENYIQEIKPDRNILVLSANQKYKDLRKMILAFQGTGITDFVITKTDETDTFGFLVNILDEFPKNIAYVTNGQEVPGDIMDMDPKYWVEKIFEGYQK